MRPLTPNGDIVKRQRVDPLAVWSREGIYELARGIALRMAWTKPEAYERAVGGDWSFVDWEKTPFFTQYKIPWKYDSNVSPLMFASVRTLIDEWYRRFLSKSERYAGGKRYFTLASSKYDRFGSFVIRSDNPPSEFDYIDCAMGVIGAKGWTREPFLPDRLNDLKIDCGNEAILAAAEMIGAVDGTTTPDLDSLRDYARPFYDGYDELLGANSFDRFKENSLALEDDWEMGEAALIGLFDRGYWAMESSGGSLIHPDVEKESEDVYREVNVNLEVEIVSEEDADVLVIRRSSGGMTTRRESPVTNYTADSEIVLEKYGNSGDGIARWTVTSYVGPVAEHPDVKTDPEYTLVENVSVAGEYRYKAYWRRRVAESFVSTWPEVISNPVCETRRVLSLKVRDGAVREDHISEVTWIFERRDTSSYDAPSIHDGKMLDAVQDKTLSEAYGEYLEGMKEREVMSDYFSDISVNVEVPTEEYREPITNTESMVDFYTEDGDYLGSCKMFTDESVREGMHYITHDARGEESFDRTHELALGVEWNIGSMPYDPEMRIKNAIIGRSDIPL